MRVLALIFGAALGVSAGVPNLFNFQDPTGEISTDNVSGAIDTSNPFFQSLGTNGRACATCHLVDNAFSFSAANARTRFATTGGTDPLFADVDGANCSGVERSDALVHSLILEHGLIRISLPVPSSPQFTVETIYDPYGCADVTDPVSGQRSLSVYRRPLPSTNLGFLSAVMFDGRETVAPLTNADTFRSNLEADLTHQAIDATLGHAQASHAPTDHQLSAIVRFELSLFTAQATDAEAGSLNAEGATGGPKRLADQAYYPGINDSLGSNPTGAAFANEAFTLFARWGDLSSAPQARYNIAREQVAAGEDIFNTFPLTITGVGGLNDALDQTTIRGTCTTCHDTPNVGNHSLPVPLDIGVSHPQTFEPNPVNGAALTALTSPELPIFKITCTVVQPPAVIYTSDPGRALITGHCSDLNRVKGPVLRGLAARAPYFHNGAAATLMEVVEFYNERFQMALSDEQKQQLVAFLHSL
jgi:cytochrome c peroxidase